MAPTEKQADIQDRISEIRKMRLGDIADNSHNWRLHPERQRKALSEVYKKVGWAGMPLVYFSEREGKLTYIDGHLRKEETPDLTVRVAITDLNDAEADILLSTYDPLSRLAEVNVDALADLEKSIEVKLEDFWPIGELETLLEGLNGDDEVEETELEIDKAEELREQYGVELGQIWYLGEHRLAVGDCTDKEVVEAVMRGELAQMVFADPPYGQAWLSNHYGPNASSPNPMGKLKNDDIPQPDLLVTSLEVLAETDAAIYVCTRWAQCETWRRWLENYVKVRNIIIWQKNNWSAGDLEGSFGFMYEQIIFAAQGKHKLRGTRLPDVWQFDRVPPTLHPTTKPIDLVARCIEKSSDANDIVADFFLGSGTTMIACENLGRRCRGIEIDPGYAAVSIHRWEQYIGQKAELI